MRSTWPTSQRLCQAVPSAVYARTRAHTDICIVGHVVAIVLPCVYAYVVVLVCGRHSGGDSDSDMSGLAMVAEATVGQRIEYLEKLMGDSADPCPPSVP